MKDEKQRTFQRRIEEEASWGSQGSANEMWDKMAKRIRKVAKEILGESRGVGLRGKESWGWDTYVQDKVKVKRECFKEWSLGRNVENREKYKIARKEPKKAVSKARTRAFKGQYQSLGTKEGKRGI